MGAVYRMFGATRILFRGAFAAVTTRENHAPAAADLDRLLPGLATQTSLLGANSLTSADPLRTHRPGRTDLTGTGMECSFTGQAAFETPTTDQIVTTASPSYRRR